MFELYDEYENPNQPEYLGSFDTYAEARNAMRIRIQDTDGECDCVIIQSC